MAKVASSVDDPKPSREPRGQPPTPRIMILKQTVGAWSTSGSGSLSNEKFVKIEW